MGCFSGKSFEFECFIPSQIQGSNPLDVFSWDRASWCKKLATYLDLCQETFEDTGYRSREFIEVCESQPNLKKKTIFHK